MKKLFTIITLLFFCISFTVVNAEDKNNIKPQNLKCVAAALIDQESGRILYSKNGDKILPMASTTKIITAITAIEKGNLNDVYIVSQKAAATSGSNAGLKAGEKISLEELLYGLMLRSGNDAAVAIAESISGNVQDFVKLMNDKATEIGAYNTSFVTPHGLDADEHYTTAEDLAKITAYALKNETFSKIVSTKEISSGKTGKFNRSYININKFLYRIDNADGVKTGYTGGAGKCLVASVKHQYGRYICVVLNSADRWKDAENLIKYAENNYHFVKIIDSDEPVKTIKVYGGNKKFLTVKTSNALYLPLLNDNSEEYKIETYTPSVMFSPIKINDIVGNIVVFSKDKVIAKYPVYSDNDIKRKNFIDTIKEMIARE